MIKSKEEYEKHINTLLRMGNWACKYCENQEHVYEVLNEIDKELGL